MGYFNNRNLFILRHFESDRIWAAALVVGEVCEQPSHWRQTQTLSNWLQSEGVPGICGVDTRALTKKIREHGTLLARLVQGHVPALIPEPPIADPNKSNLVSEVCL